MDPAFDLILNGARPDELPTEQPTSLELVFVLKDRRAIRLAVLPALRVRADAMIE
jgi:hypothetical protein